MLFCCKENHGLDVLHFPPRFFQVGAWVQTSCLLAGSFHADPPQLVLLLCKDRHHKSQCPQATTLQLLHRGGSSKAIFFAFCFFSIWEKLCEVCIFFKFFVVLFCIMSVHVAYPPYSTSPIVVASLRWWLLPRSSHRGWHGPNAVVLGPTLRAAEENGPLRAARVCLLLN